MVLLLAWMIHGVVLAALVRGALRVTRGPSAAMRFALYWSALIVVLALPLASLALARLAATPPPARMSATPIAAAPAVQTVTASATASVTALALSAADAAATWRLPVVQLPQIPDWLVAIGIGLWLGIVVLALLRIALGIDAIARLKRSTRPFPAARERRLAGWMEARRRGRLVELCLSDDVASASFLGLTRPVIAVSPALAATLSDEELDLTVLHEFAHVQRRDDWSKLAQLSVMAIFGWHPAVRLLDRAIDLERESACDDWVVRATGSPRCYARCLVKIAETMPRATAALVPGAHGAEAPMETRIKRLLDRTRTRHAWAPLPAMASAFTMAALAVLLSHVSPIAAMVRTTGAASAMRMNATNGTGAAALAASRDGRGTAANANAGTAADAEADADRLKVDAIVASSEASANDDVLYAHRIPRLNAIASSAMPSIRQIAFTSSSESSAPSARGAQGMTRTPTSAIDLSAPDSPSSPMSESTTTLGAAPRGDASANTHSSSPASAQPRVDAPPPTSIASPSSPNAALPGAAARRGNSDDVASADATEARADAEPATTNADASANAEEAGNLWGAGAVGSGFKAAGSATGGSLKDAGAATGSGLRSAGNATSKATTYAASKTGDGLKSAGAQTARAFKRAFGSIF